MIEIIATIDPFFTQTGVGLLLLGGAYLTFRGGQRSTKVAEVKEKREGAGELIDGWKEMALSLQSQLAEAKIETTRIAVIAAEAQAHALRCDIDLNVLQIKYDDLLARVARLEEPTVVTTTTTTTTPGPEHITDTA